VRDEVYVEFSVFSDRGPANSLSSWLQSEGVPCYVEPRALSGAVETRFIVFVLKNLEHRARWIVSQMPPSEVELEFLATGKLPGQEEGGK
jgi:hypothetical protein